MGPDDSGVAVGTVLAGRYRIDGMLGSGGMGRVYRGEHTGIGRPVAVKVLHSELDKDPEAAMRFQREAVALGRLDHPNIVAVTDFGVLDNGSLFLVMEALDGEHLGDRLARDKRVPWPEALAIIRSVLLGLRHAHDRGVVHRDIKPDNIFVANKDGLMIAKVLDFGIAKLFAGTSDQQSATRAGLTVGTPTYLSPEQAVGGAITPATDVYSTSVVLYELLVGRAPFESSDPLSLMTAHVGGEVPAFHDLAPGVDIPDAVEQLVRHGLAKAPAERIDAAAYMEAIDRLLGTEAATPGARASRSIGIPLGPFAASTPPPGALTDELLQPSSDVMALPVAEPAPPPPAPLVARPVAPRRPRVRRVFVLLALLAGAIAFYRFRPQDAADPPPPPRVDHQRELAAALDTLQHGATCDARKHAIDRLVELGDRKAVSAIETARARGKLNACLRATADHAIQVLGKE